MKRIMPDLSICKTCTVGSCCYEGAELTKREMKKILNLNLPIKKPWFRLVRRHEKPDGKNIFTTIMRDDSCVFHDKNNRCVIYTARPRNCREFPLEGKEIAQYYTRLCVAKCAQWPNNAVRRAYRKREKQ